MRILVGGETRKCGKTSLVCRILSWFPEARWLAVKVSAHRHAEPHPTGGDTARFLASGAAAAVLIEAEGPEAAEEVAAAAHGWTHIIVESTSAAAWFEADVRLLVRSGPGFSAKQAARTEVFRPSAIVGSGSGELAAGGEELRRFLADRWKEE